mmetsp:Transcript_82082/g.129260  ORF Transcript_82082/g.129260 Transcript_82082/m.129260 type:complete len:972 (-) Transcript_82082:67-2982(-)
MDAENNRRDASETVERAPSFKSESASLSSPISIVKRTLVSKEKADEDFWSSLKSVDYLREVYEHLDPQEVSKAACRLEIIVTCDELQPEAADCKVEFRKAVFFKGRPMETCTILHFAIWLASESDFALSFVDKVLQSMSDPTDVMKPGILPAGPHRVLYPAIQMAAGLGLKQILKMLTEYACEKIPGVTIKKLVNEWVVSEDIQTGERTRFCQPIHDATFGGQGDVTLWLLKHGADAIARNFGGITPLHFLAWKGVLGDTESNAKRKMRNIVQLMVESCKDREPLESEADMSKFVANATKVTPLEIAVQDASSFPQDSVGLLAPCLYNPAKLSYFEDIKRISAVTPKGAYNLVKAIAERGQEDQDILMHFRRSAQVKGASDLIASIFYAAPEAASEMLELLETEPEVQDSAHHPLPAHCLLRGSFSTPFWHVDVPMLATYQADKVCVGKLEWPYWKWRSSLAKLSESEKVELEKSCQWQETLLTAQAYHSRLIGVKRVSCRVCLMPNILDIDILMSLASLMDSHSLVMMKKTVQGVIFVLWENLIKKIWLINVVFCVLDLLALLTLVFFLRLHSLSPVRSSVETLALAGVIAGVARSVLEFASIVIAMLKKSYEFNGDEIMTPMWSLSSDWFWRSIIWPFGHTLCMFLFLFVHLVEASAYPKIDKYIYCVCLLTSGLQLIGMFRFQVEGSAIYTIRRTATSSAANQVVCIFGMIFVAVVFILLVLAKGDDDKLVINAIRGWLFADGDGFNGMHMEKGLSDLAVIGVVAAFFFNVVVLNMIIAVYGNEYDKARNELKFDFLRGRANYCTQNILASYLFPYEGEACKRFLICLAVLLMGVCTYGSFYYRSVWLAGLVSAVAQKLLLVATMQCSWFSPEGGDWQNQRRYLWMCCDHEWQGWLIDSSVKEELALKDAAGQSGQSVDLPSEGSRNYRVLDDRFDELNAKMDKVLERMESQIPKSPRLKRSLQLPDR